MPAGAARGGRAGEQARAPPGALQAPGGAAGRGVPTFAAVAAAACPRAGWGGTGAVPGARPPGLTASPRSRGLRSSRRVRGRPVPPPAAPHAQLRLRPGKGRASRPRSRERRSGPCAAARPQPSSRSPRPPVSLPVVLPQPCALAGTPPPCLIQHPVRCPRSGPLLGEAPAPRHPPPARIGQSWKGTTAANRLEICRGQQGRSEEVAPNPLLWSLAKTASERPKGARGLESGAQEWLPRGTQPCLGMGDAGHGLWWPQRPGKS